MVEISVIIPCYNQGIFVEEAVNSVVNQTNRNWEIIIIDDGSTDDETIRILNGFNAPNTQIIRTKNYGLPTARNTGISKAKGQFILPLDADDRIGATYLDKGMGILKKNVKVQLVYSYGRYFGENNDSMPRGEVEFNYKNLLLYNSIFCSAIFRKKDFENVGGYSANMTKGWEDWDLWIRLLAENKQVYCIPEELFFYRVKKQSMITSIQKDIVLQNELLDLLYENNSEIFNKFFGSPIAIYREIGSLRSERKNFESVKNSIYSSMSYKVGNTLLAPFKWLYKKVVTKDGQYN